MAEEVSFNDIQVPAVDIHVCKIGLADLWQSLREGYDDFNARPSHFAFLLIIYPLFALFLTLFLVSGRLLQFAFPMIAGETQATCYEMAKDFAALWKNKAANANTLHALCRVFFMTLMFVVLCSLICSPRLPCTRHR